MTEEEAKAKWCPFARVAGQMGGEAQGTSFNRWTSGAAGGAADPAACIASACMAWRTQKRQVERRETGLGHMPVEPYERYVSEGWRQLSGRGEHGGLLYERTVAEEAGYCGLAGKP